MNNLSVAGDNPEDEPEVEQNLEQQPDRDAETGESSQPEKREDQDQPTQSISQMLLAMEQISDDSSQDSMKSSQSEGSSVKSNQSGPSTRKPGQLGVGKQVSNQVLAEKTENPKAAKQNADQDDVTSFVSVSSSGTNQNGDNNDDAKSSSSMDVNTDTKSEDSYKENSTPNIRKIVVNPIEMADIVNSTIKTGNPGEVPALADLPVAKATVPTSNGPDSKMNETNGADSDNSSDSDEPTPSTSTGDITPIKDASNNPGGFFKRKIKSPFKRSNSDTPGGESSTQKKKYRIMCQCGAKNCRKYLY